MNEIIEKEDIKIEDMIYEFRGVQVMLDRHLAMLYNVETKVFMQSVKRNLNKFPENFMFQLTYEEFLDWRSQFVTSKNDLIGLRRPPYAFTEYGIAMLSGILRSEIAVKTSIAIINAFVNMRHFLLENQNIYKSITNMNNKLVEHDNKINYLFSKFDKKEQLFLQGEIFDAYSSFISIFKEADNEIIVVDSYADITFLDLIRNIKCNIILITKNSNRLSDIEIDKYNDQYHNLKAIRDNSFHDRYFILDRKTIYHSGTSINNAGDKTFMITRLNDEFVINNILSNVLSIIQK